MRKELPENAATWRTEEEKKKRDHVAFSFLSILLILVEQNIEKKLPLYIYKYLFHQPVQVAKRKIKCEEQRKQKIEIL
jgi:hypothetical protein